VKGVATRFFKLTASAWDMLAGGAAIPKTSLSIGGIACDASGCVYVQEPDNDWRDPTVRAQNVGHGGQTNYTFDVEVEKAYLTITRGGVAITGQTNTVIVGEQVALSCGLSPGLAPITNFQWTVPGNRVKDFYVSSDALNTNGWPVALTNSDLATSSIVFYWVDGSGGSLLEVQCTAQVKGETMTAKTKFNVIRPSADWLGFLTGTVNVTNPLAGSWILQFGSGSNPRGFTEVLTNINLNNYTGSGWRFVEVQTGNSATTLFGTNGINTAEVSAGIDNTFDDWFLPFGTNNASYGDSPSQPLPATKISVTRTDSFSTHLMFKPSGGIAVPLRRIDWNWSGTAGTNGANGWVLTSSPTNAAITAANIDTLSFPAWTNSIHNGTTNILQ
jgi:hypothetical protein